MTSTTPTTSSSPARKHRFQTTDNGDDSQPLIPMSRFSPLREAPVVTNNDRRQPQTEQTQTMDESGRTGSLSSFPSMNQDDETKVKPAREQPDDNVPDIPACTSNGTTGTPASQTSFPLWHEEEDPYRRSSSVAATRSSIMTMQQPQGPVSSTTTIIMDTTSAPSSQSSFPAMHDEEDPYRAVVAVPPRSSVPAALSNTTTTLATNSPLEQAPVQSGTTGRHAGDAPAATPGVLSISGPGAVPTMNKAGAGRDAGEAPATTPGAVSISGAGAMSTMHKSGSGSDAGEAPATTPGAVSIAGPGAVSTIHKSMTGRDAGEAPATTPGAVAVSGPSTAPRKSAPTAADPGDGPAQSLQPPRTPPRPGAVAMTSAAPFNKSAHRQADGGDAPAQSMTPPRGGESSPGAARQSRRRSSRKSTKFDPGDAPASTPSPSRKRPSNTTFALGPDRGDDPMPDAGSLSSMAFTSHRSVVNSVSARQLYHEEELLEDVEEEEMPSDQIVIENRPGAFAIGLGNRIRPRLKETESQVDISNNTASNNNSASLRPQDPQQQQNYWMENSPPTSGGTSWQYDADTTASPVQPQHSVITAATVPIVQSILPHEQANAVEATIAEQEETKRIPKRYRWIIALFGLILLGMAIAVPLVLTSDSNPANPVPPPSLALRTPAPTIMAAPFEAPTHAPQTAAPTSLERFLGFLALASNISSDVDLATDGTPQRRALQWISDVDPAQLDPNDPTLENVIQDRYAAALLYYAIALDTKEDSPADWWLGESSICEWNEITEDNVQGILCLDPSRPTVVTNLVVERANIDGTIPSEIGHFNSLWTLDLNQNGLGGSIPSELAKCVELDTLDLTFNKLTGPIPSTFTVESLPLLRGLGLSSNDLSGSLPSGLFSLTGLETLFLFRNNIQNGIPTEIGNLSSLRYLDLGENPTLGSSIPTEMGNLTKLEVLMIAASGLISFIPSELGRLTNLKDLNLRSNALDGTLPQALVGLEQLTSINLFSNFLTGTIPDLSGLTNLEKFNFLLNSLSGTVDGLCNSNPNLTMACAQWPLPVACSCCEELGGSCNA